MEEIGAHGGDMNDENVTDLGGTYGRK